MAVQHQVRGVLTDQALELSRITQSFAALGHTRQRWMMNQQALKPFVTGFHFHCLRKPLALFFS